MNKYWNGLYSDDETFLSHEWSKHGTCFDGNIDSFFSTAVKLND
jgi:ribonuclease T2